MNRFLEHTKLMAESRSEEKQPTEDESLPAKPPTL
jgi:hypothetical protein